MTGTKHTPPIPKIENVQITYPPYRIYTLTIRSRTRPSVKHTLTCTQHTEEDEDTNSFTFSCSCEGWSYRGKCYHTDTVSDVRKHYPERWESWLLGQSFRF